MEYKLSDIINKLDECDYIGQCMIVETEQYIYKTKTFEPGYLQFRVHTTPSYGGYYSSIDDDPEDVYAHWWGADICFNKETGLVASTSRFLSSMSSPKEGDTIIIDVDYSDRIVADDTFEDDEEEGD